MLSRVAGRPDDDRAVARGPESASREGGEVRARADDVVRPPPAPAFAERLGDVATRRAVEQQQRPGGVGRSAAHVADGHLHEVTLAGVVVTRAVAVGVVAGRDQPSGQSLGTGRQAPPVPPPAMHWRQPDATRRLSALTLSLLAWSYRLKAALGALLLRAHAVLLCAPVRDAVVVCHDHLDPGGTPSGQAPDFHGDAGLVTERRALDPLHSLAVDEDLRPADPIAARLLDADADAADPLCTACRPRGPRSPGPCSGRRRSSWGRSCPPRSGSPARRSNRARRPERCCRRAAPRRSCAWDSS